MRLSFKEFRLLKIPEFVIRAAIVTRMFVEKYININWLIYSGLLGLIIVFRYMVLVKFGFKFTDSDQSIMWMGLKDYSNGIFHEPRFYGQAYNTMLEALLAVPLYKLGCPPYKALPFITSILTLIPYIIISLTVFLKKSPKLSILILSIPLLLPIEYSLVTSLSRGFVTGVFISSLGVVGLFYSKSKITFALSAFIAVIGYSVNSNSVLISFFCLLYLFMMNLRNKNYYLFSSIGFIFGIIIHFYTQYFYILNPYYDLHQLQVSFSVKDLFLSFKNLNVYFNDVTPVFWTAGFLVLFMFFIISGLLFRIKKYRESLLVTLIPFAIVMTLGIDKVHDGSNSVFFPYSRMYLSIPILLCMSLSFFSGVIKSKYFYLYLFIPFVFFLFSFHNLDRSVAINTGPAKKSIITVVETSGLLIECNNLKSICDDYKIQLVIISDHWGYDILNYGCPACFDSFPNTLRPVYERRTWRLIEDENKIYNQVLVIDYKKNLTEKLGLVKIADSDGFYLLKNNQLRTINLIDSLQIECRKYK